MVQRGGLDGTDGMAQPQAVNDNREHIEPSTALFVLVFIRSENLIPVLVPILLGDI